mmetsp:Transcript_66773/g.134607  ORF Transcript_66773/g.134607 Transcript_66773/m.134607 type:complete len:266 (-) Transcript_66773:818-1615(-)
MYFAPFSSTDTENSPNWIFPSPEMSMSFSKSPKSRLLILMPTPCNPSFSSTALKQPSLSLSNSRNMVTSFAPSTACRASTYFSMALQICFVLRGTAGSYIQFPSHPTPLPVSGGVVFVLRSQPPPPPSLSPSREIVPLSPRPLFLDPSFDFLKGFFGFLLGFESSLSEDDADADDDGEEEREALSPSPDSESDPPLSLFSFAFFFFFCFLLLLRVKCFSIFRSSFRRCLAADASQFPDSNPARREWPWWCSWWPPPPCSGSTSSS